MKNVLIIEDNDDNMALITFILESAGYRTMPAMTGMAGVEAAKRERPDFIILDIQLPDIHGDQVAQILRATPETRDIPIIAMTSFAMAGDRERLLASGCTAYIEKPIDPMRVLEQIRQAVGE